MPMVRNHHEAVTAPKTIWYAQYRILNTKLISVVFCTLSIRVVFAINTDRNDFRNFLNGLPKELVDSARVDGAKEIRIMWSIMMPISKPIFATLAIWNITGTWNSYMEPTIYLKSSEKFVLQQILRSILIEMDASSLDMSFTGTVSDDLSIQVRCAVFVISMVPMIIMYPFAQKHFVKGVSVGAVKG